HAVILPRSSFRGLRLSDVGRNTRQLDLNNRSALRIVVSGDVAAVLLHDAVADTEPQSRAFAHTLGGVERIEDSLGILDPRSVVDKLRGYVSALADHANLKLSRSPRLQNGIDGVVDDIQEDLLNLMRIGHHHRRFGWSLAVDLDVIDLEIVVAQREGFVEHP